MYLYLQPKAIFASMGKRATATYLYLQPKAIFASMSRRATAAVTPIPA